MLLLGRQKLHGTHFPSYICSNKVSSSSTIFCRLSGSFSRGKMSFVEGFGPRWTISLEFLSPDMTAEIGHRELELSRTLESQNRVPMKYAAHAETAGSSDAPRLFPLNRRGLQLPPYQEPLELYHRAALLNSIIE